MKKTVIVLCFALLLSLMCINVSAYEQCTHSPKPIITPINEKTSEINSAEESSSVTDSVSSKTASEESDSSASGVSNTSSDWELVATICIMFVGTSFFGILFVKTVKKNK